MRQLTWIGGVWMPRVCRESDLGLWRGDSIVEVFEAKGTTIFHWDDHYKRMLAACEGHIPMDKLPSGEEILRKIDYLLKKKGYEYSVIHMQVTPGESENLKVPDGKPMLTIDVRSHQIQEIAPLALKTIPEKRSFPLFKLGASYGNIPRFMRYYKINEEGFDSFLYWDGREGILEGPYENIFFITKDKWILTAGAGVLHGVTRGIILSLAKDSGLFQGIVECNVHLARLDDCAEAFLTSTTKGTAPIRRIDGYSHFKIGDRTYTSKLRKLFLKYRENYFKERGA